MHAAPNGAVLGREELKWQNNGAIVSHNRGLRPRCVDVRAFRVHREQS